VLLIIYTKAFYITSLFSWFYHDPEEKKKIAKYVGNKDDKLSSGEKFDVSFNIGFKSDVVIQASSSPSATVDSCCRVVGVFATLSLHMLNFFGSDTICATTICGIAYGLLNATKVIKIKINARL
jgi:hypothetical protein